MGVHRVSLSAATYAHRVLDRPLEELLSEARGLRRSTVVTYSPKVFIPLTKLCRDVCHYCTFAGPPRRGERAYLAPDEVLDIARAGAAAGCTRGALHARRQAGAPVQGRARGARRARLRDDDRVPDEDVRARPRGDGPAPAREPGRDVARGARGAPRGDGVPGDHARDGLRPALRARRPAFRLAGQAPAARLETLRLAGELRVPFTTGILIGIGETREERIEALEAIAALHREHGHIQEVIVQNFRAKPGTKMAAHAEPSLDDLLWTAAVARLVLPADVHVQCPPNLSYDDFPRLLDAGIDDWGGVSPVTIDHVNPEAPWPEIERLRGRDGGARPRARAAAAGVPGVPRLGRWLEPRVLTPALRSSDADGLAREDGWFAGAETPAPFMPARRAPDHDGRARRGRGHAPLRRPRRRAPPRPRRRRRAAPRGERRRGHLRRHAERQLHERLLLQVRLLRVLEGQARREPARPRVRRAARGDRPPRARGVGPRRGRDLPPGRDPSGLRRRLLRIGGARRSRPSSRTCTCTRSPRSRSGRARRRSACRSTTISPGSATPASRRFPGTAAEILDDEVRAVLCPDKVNTEQWLEVHRTAHRVGLRSTATIMFGHVDTPRSWARHLLRVRDLQQETGGFTELVPLPSCTWRRRST